MEALGGGERRAPTPLPFSAVNRPGSPGYVAGLQRHHLIPRAIQARPCFAALFANLGAGAGLEDFRHNGILLPSSDAGAVRMGLPLHRGPHRDYSAMVAERMGEIARQWSRRLDRAAALNAVRTLQQTLRGELLSPRRSLRLHALDPLCREVDFTRLDALAETLWTATQPRYGAVLAESAAIAA